MNPELSSAQQDLFLIRHGTALFLTLPKLPMPTRYCRGANVGLAVRAAVVRFDGGLAVDGSHSCGLQITFGNYQDQSKAYSEKARQLARFQFFLIDYVNEFLTNTLVSKTTWQPLMEINLNWLRLEIRGGFSSKIKWLVMNRILLFTRKQSHFVRQPTN